MTIARLINVSAQSTDMTTSRELNDVSMSFPDKKFTAILGPSGSSKSLLIEAIGGLAEVNTGEIITCGTTVTGASSQTLAQLRSESVAFVFSNHNVVPSLTIEENLFLAHRLTRRTVDRSFAKEVIHSFDLFPYLERKASKTPADVHQRLAIARAILKEAQLLLAQEPTKFLRHNSSEKVLDSFRRCSREYGISIIMSTHSNFVASYADEVHLFLDGSPAGNVVNPSLHSLAFARENTTYWA
ncbi:ABC transporter ATP-binding protein [Arcanobacterium phocisimile]|uniref:ABC transporter ATP-binding protein n=1 Tax=Arcanobacterium phocisimile TaxID=1302235 RepID=A0ABX7IIC4_9ACTO|nr:ABC transporter ATP-binding protein [Arcanobacterium phocisimile]QRV02577.1 ABC transporter ATP-binding protein [Arcanobacterium phocisimile]